MNFRKIATLALFATTLCLSSAVIANAQESKSARVQLAVESVCGQRDHLFNIRNTGFVTSSVLRYRIVVRASEEMPAFVSRETYLLPLAPGQVFRIMAPRSAWGLKVSIEIHAAPGLDVTQASPAGVTYPNFCW